MIVIVRDDLLLMSTPPHPVKGPATESDSASSEQSTTTGRSLDTILNCTPSDAVCCLCCAKNFPFLPIPRRKCCCVVLEKLVGFSV